MSPETDSTSRHFPDFPEFPDEPNTADIDSATGRIRHRARASRDSVSERQEKLVARRLRLRRDCSWRALWSLVSRGDAESAEKQQQGLFLLFPALPAPPRDRTREAHDLRSARLAWPFCSLARRKDISDAMQCDAHSRNSRSSRNRIFYLVRPRL